MHTHLQYNDTDYLSQLSLNLKKLSIAETKNPEVATKTERKTNLNNRLPYEYTKFIESAPLHLKNLKDQFQKMYTEYSRNFSDEIFDGKMTAFQKLDNVSLIDNELVIENRLLCLEVMQTKLINLRPSVSLLITDINAYQEYQKIQIPEILLAIQNSNINEEIKASCIDKLKLQKENFDGFVNSFHKFKNRANLKYNKIEEIKEIVTVLHVRNSCIIDAHETLCSIHGGNIENYTPYEDAINEACEILFNYYECSETEEQEYPQEQIRAILKNAYDTYTNLCNYKY